MYKTGDLARWLPDGTIEFLGRNDLPGEDPRLPHRARRDRSAAQSVRRRARSGGARARRRSGDKRLVAYLVADEDRRAGESRDLREYAGAQLPEYMVPSAFVQLDALPLTANGKLDRKALPAPEATALCAARIRSAARRDRRRRWPRIWQELLRVERVGRHDNFFELGGHSLLAVQLISHIRARWVSSCRCATCSSTSEPSVPWPMPCAPRVRSTLGRIRASPTAASRCRCRWRNNGCGSSINSTRRRARRTTCRRRCGCSATWTWRPAGHARPARGAARRSAHALRGHRRRAVSADRSRQTAALR